MFRNKAIKLDWWTLLGFTRTEPQFRPLEDEVEYRIKRLVREREALRVNCDHLGREISALRAQCDEMGKQLLAIVDSASFPKNLGEEDATTTKNL